MEETLERGQKITLKELKKMGWQELEFPESKNYGRAIILKKDKKRMLYNPKKETVGLLFESKSSIHRKKEVQNAYHRRFVKV